jgi:hypothetical protein
MHVTAGPITKVLGNSLLANWFWYAKRPRADGSIWPVSMRLIERYTREAPTLKYMSRFRGNAPARKYMPLFLIADELAKT